MFNRKDILYIELDCIPVTCWVEKKKNFTENWNEIGGTKSWSKFLGQNDSIFSLPAPRGKISHFDLKKLKHWRN